MIRTIDKIKRKFIVVCEDTYSINAVLLQQVCERTFTHFQQVSAKEAVFQEDAILFPYGTPEFVSAIRNIHPRSIVGNSNRFAKVPEYVHNNFKEGKKLGTFKWLVIDNCLVDGCEMTAEFEGFSKIESDSMYNMNMITHIQDTIVDGWLPSENCVIHTTMIEEQDGDIVREVHNVTDILPLNEANLLGFRASGIIDRLIDQQVNKALFASRQNLPQMTYAFDTVQPTYNFILRQPTTVLILFADRLNADGYELRRGENIVPMPDAVENPLDVEHSGTVLRMYALPRGVYELKPY